ncbi:MAG: hypothetical protein DWI57_05450 [Chloroflexi bacterium]|nr:MAG: hypothetical protein DWI57_05450 [Chloroflexota bacterium]
MPSPPSQLFLARVWKEPRNWGGNAVRVQIRHVLSGETRYFRRWRDVVAFVMERMEEESPGPQPPGDDSTG